MIKLFRTATALLTAVVLVAIVALGLPAGTGAYRAAEPDDLSLLVPEVTLSSYRVIEGSLMAGERIVVEFTLTNTSVAASAYNVRLRYKLSDEDFYPVFGEADVDVISELGPGQSVVVEKALIISETAPEQAAIDLELRYTTITTANAQRETVVYLPILGANSLNVNLNINTASYVDTQMLITGYCINSSGQDLHNLVIGLEGSFSESAREVQLGDIRQGQQISIQEAVVFTVVDPASILGIYFTFSDAAGHFYRLPTQEYTITVLESLAVQTSGDTDPVPGGISSLPTGNLGWVPLLLTAWVLLGIIVFMIWLRAYRRSK